MRHRAERPAGALARSPEADAPRHRGLPDDELFAFTLGGMRPFGEMAMELVEIAAPILRGIVTGTWEEMGERGPRPVYLRALGIEPPGFWER